MYISEEELKYEREAIGTIIIIKNLIFENTVSHKNEIDHSWEHGRPCVIIHSDEEYDYLLALTSKKMGEIFQDEYFTINKWDMLKKKIERIEIGRTKRHKTKDIKGAINLRTIYKMPISGHDEVGKLTFNTYKNLIRKFKEYKGIQNTEEIIKTAKNIRGR